MARALVALGLPDRNELGWRWKDSLIYVTHGVPNEPTFSAGDLVEPLNFRGLRAYKEKFNPVWEPHYLVYPRALKLPGIVADVSALVAGGYGRIFHK